MDTQKQLIESLVDHTEELAATSIELMKLKAVDTSIQVASGLMSGIIIGLLSSVCVLFLSLGLAFWIGKMMDELYLGFVIVAGGYSVLTIIGFYFLPKRLERVIGRMIIQKAFQQS